MLNEGPKHYKWRNDPYIPVEFSVAAYRFGHSQVRPSYRATSAPASRTWPSSSSHPIFDPAAANPNDRTDSRGGRRSPRRFIDWQTFFDFGDGRARHNKKIDATLQTVLFELMGQPEDEPISLGKSQPAAQPHLKGLRGSASPRR